MFKINLEILFFENMVGKTTTYDISFTFLLSNPLVYNLGLNFG
jgi:hypothetical protein